VTSGSDSVRYRFGRFELQPGERRLLADGVAAPLGGHALDLLILLAERSGHLVTKDDLLTHVWRQVVVEENTLQSHIAALRKVLGAGAIATVSGQGYRFVLEVERIDGAGPTQAPSRKASFPRQLTSFIGREKEIAGISRLMGGTRLLTLTGAGGCGKTRLALKVAEHILDSYEDGGCFVEFAPLNDPTLIPQLVARAVSIKEQPGGDLFETLVGCLESRHLLLVLDNAEHLLDACAMFVESMLRRCARLVILVTSRERLGISGELTYRVPSLSVPSVQQGSAAEQSLGCEAAQLFIDRARLHRPDFEITPRSAASLTAICRRLDGIALAIELAASRIRTMSLEELGRHLDDRFAVLTGGSRTALPRHRTLRSLIDWSHDLLSETERTMLRRASVFAGGWSLEAAERVCGGDEFQGGQVLDALTSLAEKNLVIVESAEDGTRFGMLETIRHYAQDRLRERSEDDRLRTRHFEYFADLADDLARFADDSNRQTKLRKVGAEHDNLRAAFAWSESHGAHTERGLRAAGNLLVFWHRRGLFSEGRAWIVRLTGTTSSSDWGEAHAIAFRAAGILELEQGDLGSAEARFRACEEISRRLGNRWLLAFALGDLAEIANARGKGKAGLPLLEQALSIAREVGDPRQLQTMLWRIGAIAFNQADYAQAETAFEEALQVARGLGSWSTAHTLGFLGRVKHARGDPQQARVILVEALEATKEHGDTLGIALDLYWLGEVFHDCGDIQTAREHLSEALAVLQESENVNLVGALEGLAGLARDLAGPVVAARLWGRAQRRREEVGLGGNSPFERIRRDRLIALARAELGDDPAFDRAWDEGRSMSLDDAVRLALSIGD